MSTMDQIKAAVLRGLTLAETAQEHPNLKISTVRTYYYRVVAELSQSEREYRDRERAKRPRKRHEYHQKYQERKIVGPVQVRIGRKLVEARLEHKMNRGEFCEHFDFANRSLLSLMEQGYHDFTVSEVQVVADVLGMPVEELLAPPKITDIAA